MHIDLLAQRVRERRAELGLSQEEVAALGGPSTTTLTKIEAGTFKSLRHRTMTDLDHVLGWKVESTEGLLYGGREPRVISSPHSGEPYAGERRIEPPLVPDQADQYGWFLSQGAVDAHGEHAVVGTIATTAPDGVRSIVEVRYWPGDVTRQVSMGAFSAAVGEAHRLLVDATSIYREPKQVDAIAPDSDGYTRAATDLDDSEASGLVIATGEVLGQSTAPDDSDSERTEAPQQHQKPASSGGVSQRRP